MGSLAAPVSPSPLGNSPKAARVVGHVGAFIARGRLRSGDRLSPERELALHVGVGRPSARAGLRWLTAMDVVRARPGALVEVVSALVYDRRRSTMEYHLDAARLNQLLEGTS